MRKIVFITLEIICLIIFVSVTNSCLKATSQNSGMREVENNSQAQNQASADCIAVFREFFAYVQKPKTDIVTDEQAQNRWLTQKMRKTFVEYVKHFPKSEEIAGYPSNDTFIGVWNKPTTYSISGSRHYDFRNKDNPNDNRTIIDVLYEWDANDSLDNQYPGEKSLRSFIFVFEDNNWKLDDIYNFDDEYSSPKSLRNYFEKE